MKWAYPELEKYADWYLGLDNNDIFIEVDGEVVPLFDWEREQRKKGLSVEPPRYEWMVALDDLEREEELARLNGLTSAE